MADNKKLQYGTISGPPKKPNEPETETITATPPGRRPPNVIGNTRFEVAPEAEPSATNPPGGIKTPTEVETGSASKQPPTNVIRGVRYEVAPEPKPQSAHLAQEIKPAKTRIEESAPQYSPEDTKRLDGWKKVADRLPAGPQKSLAQKFSIEAEKNAQKNQEEKYGPVPEKDLPTIAKMYGELKNFYYQGFAESRYKLNEKENKEQQIESHAHYAQESQIYAMRYGMSSLVNLHQGLDIASWNFFFKTLGPLGIYMFGPLGVLGMPLSSVLEKIHRNEISFNMAYYGGRAWWSPYRVDYLIKTLPEEKAVDLILDVSLKTLYLVSRVSGLGLVSKTYDKYGRPKKGYVFTPLLKLQHGVVGAGDFLDKITTEGSIRGLQDELKRAISFEPGNKKLHDFIQNKLIEERFKTNWHLIPGKNELFPRVFRFLGLKGVSKNLRKTDRDILSYFAILIGGWIFDITVGNLVRLVTEKVVSTTAWQSLVDSPVLKNFQASLGVTKEFVGALPSLNTIAGGYVGYNFGGIIGQNIAGLLGIDTAIGFQVGTAVGLPVGAGFGWGYQWALNLAKNPGLMERAFSYFNTTSKLNYLSEMRSYFGNDTWSARFLDSEIKSLNGIKQFYSAGFRAPGPMLRFANWLNSPGGRFFRIPIKGLGISQILSPFEAQIHQYLPWYQGWMPPAAQYLWEVKGVVWDTMFKPSFGRLWEFTKFNSIGEWTMSPKGADLKLLVPESQVPGLSGVWKTQASGQYLLDMTEAEGGGYRVIQPRGWYQQYINFRTGLNEIFGQQGPLQQRLLRFFEGHPTLTRFVGGLREVGLTNFAGFLIGFELASALTGGNLIAALAGGVGGWFLANPILTATETLLEKFGLFNAGPAAFVGLFNTGFWLGAGAQFVAGFFGLNLPFWFPLASGLTFAFAPTILAYAGALVAAVSPTIGAFLFNLGGALAFGGVGGMVAFTTVLAVTSVAALAVFSIIIIGSAFWVPISENLKGLTATSPCFDISSPTFTDINGNNSNAIFTNGEEKTVCWTTTNKQEFYQDAITKSKTWDPPSNFIMEKYGVTITTPDGQSIVWDNVSGSKPGNYNLSVGPLTSTVPGMYGLANGWKFTITPPQNTALAAQQAAQQIKQIYDQLNNKTNPVLPKELVAQNVIPLILAGYEKDYILDKEMSYLNTYINDPQQAINSEQSVLKGLDGYVLGKQLLSAASVSSLPGTSTINSAASDVIANCAGPKTYLSCENINQLVNGNNNAWPGWTNNPSVDLQAFFDQIKKMSPSELLDTKDSLSQQKDVFQKQTNQNINSNSYPNYISQIQGISPSLTGTALDDAINKLAGQNVQNQGNFYLPAGSTIKVCLTLKYNGESGKATNLIEKDAANLPFLGPLNVPSCQAQLIIPINTPAPGNLQWPTNQKVISTGGGYSVNQANPKDLKNHSGIDIAGAPESPVGAAGNGTIIKESYEPNGFGYYIIVRGDDDFYYIYAHLGKNGFGPISAFTKNEGDKVSVNDQIGNLGASGNSSGPHLHFGVSTQPNVSSFYNNSTTTLNPCGFLQGGCP